MNKKYMMIMMILIVSSLSLQANEQNDGSSAKQSHYLSASQVGKLAVGIGAIGAFVGGLYYWSIVSVGNESESNIVDSVDYTNDDETDDVEVQGNFEAEEGLQKNIECAKNFILEKGAEVQDVAEQTMQKINETWQYVQSDECKETFDKAVESVNEKIEVVTDLVKSGAEKVLTGSKKFKKMVLTGGRNEKSSKVVSKEKHFEGDSEFQEMLKVKRKEKEQSSFVNQSEKEDKLEIQDKEELGLNSLDNNIAFLEIEKIEENNKLVLQPQDQQLKGESGSHDLNQEYSLQKIELPESNNTTNKNLLIGGVTVATLLGLLIYSQKK